MATNRYIAQGVLSEQNLYEDIVIESLRAYGQDVYYIPRDIVNEDKILGDDIPSRFNSAYIVEMYIENIEGFDGEGDLFTKFGVQIRDQATFIVSRRRWSQTVKRLDNEITGARPREGDLVYLPMSRSLFQIMHVEHEQPFYQLKNLPTYKLRCELFEYNDEVFDTGIENIDLVERLGYRQILTLQDSADIGFVVGKAVTQTVPAGTTITGEIVAYDDNTNQLVVTHIGSDDSDYNRFHLFVDGVTIKSTDSDNSVLTRLVESVSEVVADTNAQNDDFENQVSDLIDWSEDNPFGDPR